MCDGLGVTMTTYLSLGVVEYLWHVRWIRVTMTIYLSLGVVEYLLCV